MRWNWGAGVAATYVVFAAATSGFVAFAMTRPVSLVRPDYYAESLREDRQIAARANARGLGPGVSIAVERDGIRLTVPPASGAIDGSVTLYRASDAAADRMSPFSPDARGTQVLSVSGLERGHWVVKLKWTAAGREYYVEQPIVLP